MHSEKHLPLAEILSILRVPHQGILYVQSSINWLQKIGLELSEVLNTLQDWVKPAGTLVMPSYPYRGTHLDYLRRKPIFDVRHTPVKIGLIPEIFRRFFFRPHISIQKIPKIPKITLRKSCDEAWSSIRPLLPFFVKLLQTTVDLA